MGRLGNISGKEAARAFEKKAGCASLSRPTARQPISGSTGILPVQHRREACGPANFPGTWRALIRHAGLSVEEFLELR